VATQQRKSDVGVTGPVKRLVVRSDRDYSCLGHSDTQSEMQPAMITKTELPITAPVPLPADGQQLYQLLLDRGVDLLTQRVVLYRHKDQKYPLVKYIGTPALALYQANQSKPEMLGTLVVSFFGHRENYGLLLGVWQVKGVMPTSEARSKGLLNETFEELGDEPSFFHTLEEVDVLQNERLKLEVYIGPPAIVWRRVLSLESSYPVRIWPDCPVPFPGLHNVSLVMSELRIVLPDPVWQRELSAISAIYLITDEKSGRQYVGSAYGGLGLWQRWGDYVHTGHGDNVELIQVLREAPGREKEFRFTLLEALPSSTTPRTVIARESHWKVALGSRTHGLNRN
jgi:hypothetical protein